MQFHVKSYIPTSVFTQAACAYPWQYAMTGMYKYAAYHNMLEVKCSHMCQETLVEEERF